MAATLALFMYAACYATALWCWCFGLTGLALRHCSAPNPTVHYLADASYWLLLLTYKRWVRATWLGQLLNGRRQ